MHVIIYLVPCVWGEWLIGECSQTCGGGTRENTREKTSVELYGGACYGTSSITEDCNTEECPPGNKIL